MDDLVNTIGSIGEIAKNIGVKSDDLNSAVRYADGMNKTLNAIMSVPPNYLGAIVSGTGMFGAQQPNADTVRHQQLMNYLDKQFKEINGKLDTLIEGQKKIAQGIVKLSEQIEKFRGEMHARLDVMDYKLDTIIGISYQLFSTPAQNCFSQEKTIRDKFYKKYVKGNKKFGAIDLTNFSQLEEVSKLGLSNNDLRECISFLHRVFQVASTPPSNLISSPLAARYAMGAPQSLFPIIEDIAVKEGYDNKESVRTFLESHYKPTFDWIITRKSIANKKLSEAAMFAMFASPSPELLSYQKKTGELVVEHFESCSRNTKLSEPAYRLLCSDQDKDALIEDAPKYAQKDDETRAENLVQTWLQNPLMQEPLVKLTRWALFFSPINDIQKSDDSLYQNRDEFLNAQPSQNAPMGLLIPALKTVTLAIVQVNMLHGDFTANLLFETLWHQAENRFLTRAEIDQEGNDQADRKLARIMIEKNPFLARNVLMMALDRALDVNYKTPTLVYNIALQYMREMDINPTSQLDLLFANKIKFQNDSKPILEADYAVDCTTLDENQLAIKCYQIPKAQVVDVSVPLPTADEFAHRVLTYPPIMYDLINVRDQLASRLTHYTMLDLLASSDEQIKLQAVEDLISSNQLP